ncbi:hypothetical protein MKW92_010032 [Papaver armeniacum]|nr:hypothetical protein MKW92_010032 [Papaver armeniacum]
MAAPRSHNLHFFKVLMPGYDENLVISLFISLSMISKRTRKRLCYVCRMEEDSKWCFSGDYWREFVKFHDLNVHEFLVFEHKGDLLFNVFIYDSPTDGDGMICEKEFPSRGLFSHTDQQLELILRAGQQVTPRRRRIPLVPLASSGPWLHHT